MARIQLKDLRKTFGSIEAVKRLNLTIEDGEFIVLVGPSGCGKTTTLRMIAGFEDPTEGEIIMDGQVVNELEPNQRRLGMVFQSHALFPHKTVAENIEFGPRMQGMDKAQRHQKVRDVADIVRISHLLNKYPGECSGGEAQRVALARTLITDPETYLLDEPLSSLDAKLRRELRAEADRLHQRLKKTFVYVTHDQEEAMTLADRIVVMRGGEVVQQGTPMEIYGDPANYFVADFFGSPSMNLIDGAVAVSGRGRMFKSSAFSMKLPALYDAIEPGQATLGIRPEHVRVGGSKATFKCKLSLVEPMGKETLVYIDYGGARDLIGIVDSGRRGLKAGATTIAVELAPEHILLFGADGERVRGKTGNGAAKSTRRSKTTSNGTTAKTEAKPKTAKTAARPAAKRPRARAN